MVRREGKGLESKPGVERRFGEPGRERLGKVPVEDTRRLTLRSLMLSIRFNLDVMMGSDTRVKMRCKYEIGLPLGGERRDDERLLAVARKLVRFNGCDLWHSTSISSGGLISDHDDLG